MKTQIAREKTTQNRFPPQTSTDHSPPYGSQFLSFDEYTGPKAQKYSPSHPAKGKNEFGQTSRRARQ
ncbi:hypothetical protein PGTUg99_008239 [Puccinia graminis f. sp. tritici]|uniref:Uncharacterized protein n=1 Tax=Puccinia graminis f. sp. tritici TaxID=56615 RepID=A0A5B0RZN8_PUCGR|nr:hypothetical protein PGTUg99_008239 [Puccinia graminis f. sp. tritici]